MSVVNETKKKPKSPDEPLSTEEYNELYQWFDSNQNLIPLAYRKQFLRMFNVYRNLASVGERAQLLLDRLREAMRLKPTSERGVAALGKGMLKLGKMI